MGDLSSSPPARIEAPSAGEGKNTKDRLAPKPGKPTAISRNDLRTPELGLDSDEDSDEKGRKHKLDERA